MGDSKQVIPNSCAKRREEAGHRVGERGNRLSGGSQQGLEVKKAEGRWSESPKRRKHGVARGLKAQ